MNATEITRAEKCKAEVLALVGNPKTTGRFLQRLIFIGCAKTCTRCGGTGEYSYNKMTGTTCFKCNGGRFIFPAFNNKLVAQVRAQVEAGKLQEYFQLHKQIKEDKALVAQYDRLNTVAVHVDYDAVRAGTPDAWTQFALPLLRTQYAAQERFNAAKYKLTLRPRGAAHTPEQVAAYTKEFVQAAQEFKQITQDIAKQVYNHPLFDVSRICHHCNAVHFRHVAPVWNVRAFAFGKECDNDVVAPNAEDAARAYLKHTHAPGKIISVELSTLPVRK